MLPFQWGWLRWSHCCDACLSQWICGEGGHAETSNYLNWVIFLRYFCPKRLIGRDFAAKMSIIISYWERWLPFHVDSMRILHGCTGQMPAGQWSKPNQRSRKSILFASEYFSTSLYRFWNISLEHRPRKERKWCLEWIRGFRLFGDEKPFRLAGDGECLEDNRGYTKL